MIWTFVWAGVVILLALLVVSAIRILREYERGVVFTLGPLLEGQGAGARDPHPGDPADW